MNVKINIIERIGGRMSQPNEPPLALESWSITVDLNDGTDFTIGSGDIEENLRDDIKDVVEQYVEQHIDHLKGKYAGEIDGSSKN